MNFLSSRWLGDRPYQNLWPIIIAEKFNSLQAICKRGRKYKKYNRDDGWISTGDPSSSIEPSIALAVCKRITD
jgi:hypothetical protein